MVRLLTAAARILLVLDEPRTFSELQAKTGMSGSVLSMNLKGLIAEGLVRKDGRFYELTDEGRRAVEELRRAVLAPGR